MFAFRRHEGLQSSRVDPEQEIRSRIGLRVVAGHPPLRHRLRRHPLREGRTDRSCGRHFQETSLFPSVITLANERTDK